MAINFAASDEIKLAIGGLDFDGGPSTIAAIVRRGADSQNQTIFGTSTSGNVARNRMGFTSANRINYGSSAANSNGNTITVATTDGWMLVAGTKASGTVAANLYRHHYLNNTWETDATTSTIADGATPGGTGYAKIGTLAASGNRYNGDILIVAAWDRVLTEAELKNLRWHLQAWYASAPKGLWLLDQSSTAQLVNDLTGLGAIETSRTATSVSTSSPPIWNRGTGIWLVVRPQDAAGLSITPDPAIITATAVAPTVTLGAVSVTPAAATVTATAIAPTVVHGSLSITPAVATITATAVAPTVKLGSVSATPGAATITATAVAPSVIQASLSITPAVATITMTAVAPTVEIETPGGAVEVTPDAAIVTMTAVAPTVVQSSVSVTPAAATATLTAIAPTVVQASISVTPAVATITITAIAPTVIVGGLQVTPEAAVITLVAIAPTVILASISVTPVPAIATMAAIAPTILIGTAGTFVLPLSSTITGTRPSSTIVGNRPSSVITTP